MFYSRNLSVKYQTIKKYQAEEMPFVTLTSSLVIIFQSFIRFGGLVFNFGVHKNFILLNILLKQHNFVISNFRILLHLFIFSDSL